MRRSSIGVLAAAIGALAFAPATVMSVEEEDQMRKRAQAREAAGNVQRKLAEFYGARGGSVAQDNRHGGPHEHKREISRRLRQAAKRA